MTETFKRYLRKFPKDSIIYRQGDSGNTMFVVHSGKIRLTRDIDGQLEDMGILEKGDFFGEMSVLEDSRRSVSAFSEEDSEVIEIDRQGFLGLLKSNIEIPIRMIRKYALKLEEMDRKFEYLLKNKREYDKGIREIISELKGTEVSGAKSRESTALAFLKTLDEKRTFPITRDSTLVGRVDPVTNIVPDIDLTPFDAGRTVSRRHARISVAKEKLYIVEEIGVTNGTFVNGSRLSPGELRQINDGDRLGFGKVELKLIRP